MNSFFSDFGEDGVAGVVLVGAVAVTGAGSVIFWAGEWDQLRFF